MGVAISVALTHAAPEAAVRSAIKEIDAMPDVAAATRLLRVELGA